MSDERTSSRGARRRRCDTSHVVFDMTTSHCRCQHCGESLHVALPMPCRLFTDIVKAFTREHRDCRPVPESGA